MKTPNPCRAAQATVANVAAAYVLARSIRDRSDPDRTDLQVEILLRRIADAFKCARRIRRAA